MRFHVVSLPHIPVTREFNACAYTGKVYRFCQMMLGLGHEVILYGVAGSNAPCSEFVPVITQRENRAHFPKHHWKKQVWPIEWDVRKPYWVLSNRRAAEEITKRQKSRDIVCVIGGTCQQPIDHILSGMDLAVVEFGIGYSGTFAKYRVFESYAHLHHVHGRDEHYDGQRTDRADDGCSGATGSCSGIRDLDGRMFDAVIPNYFDLADFPEGKGDGRYVLFMGRMIRRKGIQIAMEATAKAGATLILSGQGAKQTKGKTKTLKADGFTFKGANFDYVGYSDIEQRAELMGRATCLIAPTLYVGPFEGVAVEAQLCGTPAITTDWGAFAETVDHGRTGFRCRTLEQFVWAIRNANRLDRRYIASRARANYSMDRVALMYHEYFAMIQSLWGEGWYATRDDRTELDWLNRAT